MSAILSPCGKYRYQLSRDTGSLVSPGAVLFVMLNPSTADAEQDDPTIRRCIGFARTWGFGSLLVGNLFAYRATNPRELAAADDPVGPENDGHLRAMAQRSAQIIVAWGSNATLLRALTVMALLREASPIWSLGHTKEGWPKHPLYLPKTAERSQL